jgi:hypothetical protein
MRQRARAAAAAATGEFESVVLVSGTFALSRPHCPPPQRPDSINTLAPCFGQHHASGPPSIHWHHASAPCFRLHQYTGTMLPPCFGPPSIHWHHASGSTMLRAAPCFGASINTLAPCFGALRRPSIHWHHASVHQYTGTMLRHHASAPKPRRGRLRLLRGGDATRSAANTFWASHRHRHTLPSLGRW